MARLRPEEEQCSNCGGWRKCPSYKAKVIESWNSLPCYYPASICKPSKPKPQKKSVITATKFLFNSKLRRQGNGHV